MNIGEYWKTHQDLSATSSTVVRTLVLSGVGVVWLFHQDKDGQIILPRLVVAALITLSASALCDLLQYVWLAGVYGRQARLGELRNCKDDEDLPRHATWLNWPGYALYYGKIVLTITAYVFLGIHLFSRIKPS